MVTLLYFLSLLLLASAVPAGPSKEHSTYQTVNCALSAQFALASWCPWLQVFRLG